MHRLHRGGVTIFLLSLLPPRLPSTVAPGRVVVAALVHRRSSSSSSSSSRPRLLPSRVVVLRAAAADRERAPNRKMSTPSILPPAVVVTHADDVLVDGYDFDVTRTRLLTPRATLPMRATAVAGGGGGKKKAGGTTTKTSSSKKSHGDDNRSCVVYWMIRDVRVSDNWALLFARNLAVREGVPLRVVYSLPPPPDAGASSSSSMGEKVEKDGPPPNPSDMSLTVRHGTFLLDGLRVASRELANLGVRLDVLRPTSRESVGSSIFSYCHDDAGGNDAVAVVCDMSPLRHHRTWTEVQAAPMFDVAGVPMYQVDAHNVVPVWIASDKREVGARTLRPRINRVFARYCTKFPDFDGNAHVDGNGGVPVRKEEDDHDWEGYETYLNLDASVGVVNGVKGGREAAMERFRDFCTSKQNGLKNFDTLRNDPNHPSVCSNLSPWINAGHVSFQRLALDVRALKAYPNGTASYIEEGVVRRELSDNFVYYAPNSYDSLDAAAGWARESLELHASDPRESLYSWRELETGMTHDDLWNAAQLQLVREGKMHGFMRMYWAKKILEWTLSPSYALATAQYFNDRYAYDGNDPNGFVGVGWSIMGIHDMGWKERPVFGKIRYMNYAGCKRKFKIDQFVARYRGASENAARVSSGAKGGGIEKFLGKKRKA